MKSLKSSLFAAALGVLAFSLPAHAISIQVVGTITKIRNYTLRHPNGLANGYTMIQVSQPMTGGCTWGFVDAADKNALGILLAAKAADTPVAITYESSAASPWGDTPVCAIIAIDIG